MGASVRNAVFGALALLIAGMPASAIAQDGADQQFENGENDPFEELNRYFFEVHKFVDGLVLEPIALLYNNVVPEFGRDRVRNVLRNAKTPVVLANDLFQGEFGRAGTTITRFGINTTAGVGGLFDPATDWGHERHSEDFGQTLGVYGVGEGPYFFMPVFGPMPPRDATGRVVDTLLNPLTWVGGDAADTAQLSMTVAEGIDLRARNIETLDELERTSIDLYAAIRSLYRQSRDGAMARSGTANLIWTATSCPTTSTLRNSTAARPRTLPARGLPAGGRTA